MINIYVSHSRKFDFINELYIPLRNSSLAKKYNIILPHEFSAETYPSRKLFDKEKDNIIVFSEGSFYSNGRDTEVEWAHDLGIPIVGFYKSGQKYSKFVLDCSRLSFGYCDSEYMIKNLEAIDIEKLL